MQSLTPATSPFCSQSPQPLMREALEKKPVLSQSEARELVERCMRVLYYRDARAFNRVRRAGGKLGN